MPHSHHSHSGQFCKHAVGTLEDVVREAIRQGFDVFGLTEHVPRYRAADLYPEESSISLDELAAQFSAFLEEAHRLKQLYAPQITLLVGLETEYITEVDLKRLRETLQQFGDRIEYIVGSVHHVNGVPIDFDLPTYEAAVASFADVPESGRTEALLSAYFDAQYELMQTFKPEIIGHFDLCRLYFPALRFADYPAVYEKIKRNIAFAVEYGALFELNAAAFRKKWDTAYPGEDIVEIIISRGGRFVLSDDSHGPHAVGLNYHRLPAYLAAMKISELWYLQKCSTPNSAGRLNQAVKLDGDCSDHIFWKSNKQA